MDLKVGDPITFTPGPHRILRGRVEYVGEITTSDGDRWFRVRTPKDDPYGRPLVTNYTLWLSEQGTAWIFGDTGEDVRAFEVAVALS